MITTLAALLTFLPAVQTAMTNPDYAWPLGRSWALTVNVKITDAQLLANQPPCCTYLLADGTVFRGPGGVVFLLRVR